MADWSTSTKGRPIFKPYSVLEVLNEVMNDEDSDQGDFDDPWSFYCVLNGLRADFHHLQEIEVSESGGRMERRVMDNQGWVQRWDNRAIGFHKDFIHPALEKYLNLMVDGRSNLRILVPLCGKSLDMKWLAEQGHTVVGVEVAKQAIEEFFQEQGVPFTSEPAPAVEGTLFQSEDKKILIYCCDFFKISLDVVGYMDAIWDRASMVAINVCDRAKYGQLLQSVMSPNCKYLLSSLIYDDTKYAGPPHSLPEEAIREVYESANTMKLIDSVDVWEERNKSWGIDSLLENIFLIIPKQ